MDAPARCPCRGADDGFSLVEVVMAMLVLTVALLALVPVQTKALASVALSAERQSATGYASGAIERVRARALVPATSSTPAAPSGFTTIAAQTDPVLATSTATTGDTAFTTTVAVTDLVPSAAPVLVTVTAVTTWTSHNGSSGQRRVMVRTKVVDPGNS